MQGFILKLRNVIKMEMSSIISQQVVHHGRKKNGWTMYTTNAEAARQTEMCMIYNEAWGNAKRGLPIVGGESVNEENLKSSFDVKA